MTLNILHDNHVTFLNHDIFLRDTDKESVAFFKEKGYEMIVSESYRESPSEDGETKVVTHHIVDVLGKREDGDFSIAKMISANEVINSVNEVDPVTMLIHAAFQELHDIMVMYKNAELLNTMNK